MNLNKRIIKTGVLAVAATLVFAAFVFRAVEWSKGLDSGVVVLGQTGGTGGGGGGGGSTTACTPTSGGGQGGTGSSGGASACVVKIVPQIALGSFDSTPNNPQGLTKYSTIIQIVNTNSSA